MSKNKNSSTTSFTKEKHVKRTAPTSFTYNEQPPQVKKQVSQIKKFLLQVLRKTRKEKFHDYFQEKRLYIKKYIKNI